MSDQTLRRHRHFDLLKVSRVGQQETDVHDSHGPFGDSRDNVEFVTLQKNDS